jgi:hypothetical protein
VQQATRPTGGLFLAGELGGQVPRERPSVREPGPNAERLEAVQALVCDEEVGGLRAGKLADLIILSDHPLTVQPEAITHLDVWMKMAGGRVEHCTPGHVALRPGW